MPAMKRALPFADKSFSGWQEDLLRTAIVSVCALALIAAGQALPF